MCSAQNSTINVPATATGTPEEQRPNTPVDLATVHVAIYDAVMAIAGTHRLMLMFGAKDIQLRQWTVTDPQGYDTTVAVYNLDSNKKPDPGMFQINYQRLIQ